jgi:hypothetical protein
MVEKINMLEKLNMVLKTKINNNQTIVLDDKEKRILIGYICDIMDDSDFSFTCYECRYPPVAKLYVMRNDETFYTTLEALVDALLKITRTHILVTIDIYDLIEKKHRFVKNKDYYIFSSTPNNGVCLYKETCINGSFKRIPCNMDELKSKYNSELDRDSESETESDT